MLELTFVNPKFLWLFAIIPFLILIHFYGLKFSRKHAIKFANFEALARVTGGNKLSMNLPLLFLRFFTLLFLILSLSSPILWFDGEGGNYDFMVAIDSSGSMLADDFPPNRLQAAKDAAINFVDQVPPNTRIALMSFSGTQFIKQILTKDFDKVKNSIDEITVEFSSGTAIGDAVVSGVNQLLEEERTRVIILLTDGQSNVGTVLEKAINYANENYVTVHTIGIGTDEGGNFQGISALSKVNDVSLSGIAENTGGKFYKVGNIQELNEAYKEISEISKIKMPLPLSFVLIMLTFLTLSIEWVLVNTKFRSVP
jgi:Ca-activated chloride channel family protein